MTRNSGTVLELSTEMVSTSRDLLLMVWMQTWQMLVLDYSKRFRAGGIASDNMVCMGCYKLHAFIEGHYFMGGLVFYDEDREDRH